MNIIYASSACSSDYFEYIYKLSSHKPGQQVQKYHNLLIEGFSKLDVDVSVISAPPISRKSTKKRLFKQNYDLKNGVGYYHLCVINIPVIKNVITFFSSILFTAKIINKKKDVIIICDVLNISLASGVLFASSLFNKKSIGIVTDIPKFISKNPNSAIVKINDFLVNKFDAYIFLTEYMNQKINKSVKDYLVLEGHVDINMKHFRNSLENKSTKKICLYAGGVEKEYGVDKLVKAFIKANIENSQLHIFGTGSYHNELVELSKSNSCLVFHGLVENSKVINAEIQADLLINPRPSNQEFVKYSFPSKNMEYMASGTPVLTTILPGMPLEYLNHVYVIEDETIEGISKALSNALLMEKTKLINKGIAAKEFVLRDKNNVKQAKRILELINSINKNHSSL